MNRIEFLEKWELDFLVEKQKSFVKDTSRPYADDCYIETPFYVTVNTKSNTPLGTVKSRYTVLNNHEILDKVLNALPEDSYNLEESVGGLFQNGKKVYMFIKMTKPEPLAFANDTMDCYVYALSSHDASQRLVLGVTTKMHSCSNMFSLLMSDKDNNFVLKHTDHIQNNQASYILNLVNRNFKGVYKMLETLANTPSNSALVDLILDVVAKQGERQSSLKEEKREALLSSIHEEIASKGNTLYGVFNGLTHYLSHKHGEFTSHCNYYDMVSGDSHKFTKNGLDVLLQEVNRLNPN
jgi:hypothetical protein